MCSEVALFSFFICLQTQKHSTHPSGVKDRKLCGISSKMQSSSPPPNNFLLSESVIKSTYLSDVSKHLINYPWEDESFYWGFFNFSEFQ